MYPSLAKHPLHEAFFTLLEEEYTLKMRLNWVRGRIQKMRRHMEQVQAGELRPFASIECTPYRAALQIGSPAADRSCKRFRPRSSIR